MNDVGRRKVEKGREGKGREGAFFCLDLMKKNSGTAARDKERKSGSEIRRYFSRSDNSARGRF